IIVPERPAVPSGRPPPGGPPVSPLAAPTLLLFGLLAAGAEAAGPPGLVRDEAHLLRPATREKAEAEASEGRRLFHLDLDTVPLPPLPPEEKKRLRALERKQEVAHFAELGRAHARAAETDGIHVLICPDPRRVAVTVWPESHRAAFTEADAEALRRF